MRKSLILGVAGLLALGAAFGLTACEKDPSPTASSQRPTSSEPSTPGNEARTDPLGIETEFTMEPTESENPLNIDAQVRLNRVEGGVSEDSEGEFSRLIVFFDGDPGAALQWSTKGWQDEVLSDGSGKPIDLNGKRKLQVNIAGVAYPEDIASTQDVPLHMPENMLIKDASIDLPFEGYSQFQIAAEEDLPYRITVLDNPTRLVLDVRTR